MKISARCDYACRAILELASHYEKGEPLQIQTIAKNQRVPIKYLVQILIQLKQVGLLTSKRGKVGGYYLAKPPSRITLGDIIRLIEGQPVSVICLDKSSKTKCPLERECTIKEAWVELKKATEEVVDRMTFEDMAARSKGMRKVLAYSI